MRSVFISRSLETRHQFIKSFENEGAVLIDLPLINIVRIPFSYTPQADWIFFTSKNSIRYFFEQNPSLPSDVQYGVIRQSSSGTLEIY